MAQCGRAGVGHGQSCGAVPAALAAGAWRMIHRRDADPGDSLPAMSMGTLGAVPAGRARPGGVA